MSLEEAQSTFLAECRELLEEMESSLLYMEDNPGDADAINAVFRAAHTIKGTSGVFGFDEVEAFTHVAENLLERMRNGEMQLSSDIIALLLSSCDHIGRLVEAVTGGDALDEAARQRGAELEAGLKRLLDAAGGIPAADTTAPSTAGNDAWHISVRFAPDSLRDGFDPLSALRNLSKLGRLRSQVVGDALPPLEAMDPETCYLGIEADLETEADRETIASVFEFFEEESSIRLLPPHCPLHDYGELIASLPEEEERIRGLLVDGGTLTAEEWDVATGRSVPASVTGNPEPRVDEGPAADEANAAVATQAGGGGTKRANNIRVDAEKLDYFINLVGELVIASATNSLLAQKLGDEALLESNSVMRRLVEDIRDSALRLRMVQIGETFNRFKRVVRDVSRELGKDIQLTINGADTELDKTVVERIGDPLMHLVRNAIDHGIEPAEQRLARGKPARGRVTLDAYHESGSIVIEIGDDGGGLDRDRILSKAVERELVPEGQALSDHEVHRLIFEAGFSTADQVTNLSGRGVGMDVVRRNIEALRGTIDVDSTPEKGTTFTIRLPLTLAIIDGFLVGVGDFSYVIPLDMVLECIEFSEQERVSRSTDSRYLNLRGEVLPFLNLHEVFREPAAEGRRENVVVVQYGADKAGLVVDELLGETQTVIKPLGKLFRHIHGISGATILGSGEVAVILDVPQLVERTIAHSGGRDAAAQAALLH